MWIDGKTKLLGLVGSPIMHSLSPRLHNIAIQLLGRNEVYVPLEVNLASHQDAQRFLDWCWDLGVVGLNFTLPYKELFARTLAAGLPSINTAYRASGNWAVASTDGEGFYRAVLRLVSEWRFERLVILGNGGASLAIVEYLLNHQLTQEIDVLRRSEEKDEAWKERFFKGDLQSLNFFPFSPDAFAKCIERGGNTLVVQTTSAPLRGENLVGFANRLQWFDGALVDIVYGHPSELWYKARELGIPMQDGLPMLIEQARCSQKLWWGEAAAYEVLKESLEQP